MHFKVSHYNLSFNKLVLNIPIRLVEFIGLREGYDYFPINSAYVY